MSGRTILNVYPTWGIRLMSRAGPNEAIGLRNDSALMRRISLGDGAALKMLFADTAGSVASVAKRILGDAAGAEDIVQDTFAQVWRTAGEFEGAKGSARCWVLTIARTRALDRLRAEQRRRTTEAQPPSPLMWPRMREDDARLHARLRDLPAVQSSVLTLAYFDGMSQSEIASALNLPLGTVKTRMRAAITRLNEMLADPPPAGADSRD